MQFYTESHEHPTSMHEVSLRDDRGDVDILINGKIVAFLCQESGKLELMEVSEANQPLGVNFSAAGHILVNRS